MLAVDKMPKRSFRGRFVLHLSRALFNALPDIGLNGTPSGGLNVNPAFATVSQANTTRMVNIYSRDSEHGVLALDS